MPAPALPQQHGVLPQEDAQPHATMETRVAGQGQPKRVGRWTLEQLRQTDGKLQNVYSLI
ncbi:Calponin -like protein OV9M [Toxocara canis]|uniref:Calponin-like protein OV9M n=1 Tax=Toxocara canis TaxID=6265 RepID=A0A0B2UPZ8_TOXCA|nr:Calponin -like protein OV9M [Toxocara canis]